MIFLRPLTLITALSIGFVIVFSIDSGPAFGYEVEIIKKGLNNRSFKFTCKGNDYVYRHPGVNASNVIDRKKEYISLCAAKDLGVDNSLIHMDKTDGWKISRFIEVTGEFDFANEKHIQLLADHLKTLHEANIQVGFHSSILNWRK